MFHIGPPVRLPLNLTPEPENRFDPYAMGVFIPNDPNQLPPEFEHLAGRQIGSPGQPV